MLFDQFVETSSQFWKEYFNKVNDDIANGRTDLGLRTPLFPTILLCTRTSKYYIAELIGASSCFRGLTEKRHIEASVNMYLNRFETNSDTGCIFKFENSEDTALVDLVVTNEIDEESVKRRFPFVQLDGVSVLRRSGEDCVAVLFGENNLSTWMIRVIVLNTRENIVRIKNIEYLIVVHKGFTRNRYISALEKSVSSSNGIVGMRCYSDEIVKRNIISSQFSSLYLTNRIHETTIGEFLADHPDVLTKALGKRRFLTEPYLPWIDKPSFTTEHAINPDLLIEREDGDWDIYDLKTAALYKASLTKGKRSRRRFIDYVQEGIAQLANYREYFELPSNRAFAREKYGVTMTNPNLVLVVGNSENVNQEEIFEASRALKNVTIIDYDSLMQLFIYAGSKQDSR